MRTRTRTEIKKDNRRGYLLIQSITLARIPLAVAFLIFLSFTNDSTASFIIAFLLLLLIEATDAFDGKIARRYNLASEWGATLDPFADSISRLLIYTTLASRDMVLFLVPLSMALRDITVAYARILLAQKSRSVSARISGKVKAIVQASGAFLALSGPFYWAHIGYWSFHVLSWIIITVTLLSSIEYIKDAVIALRHEEQD